MTDQEIQTICDKFVFANEAIAVLKKQIADIEATGATNTDIFHYTVERAVKKFFESKGKVGFMVGIRYEGYNAIIDCETHTTVCRETHTIGKCCFKYSGIVIPITEIPRDDFDISKYITVKS